MKKKALLRRVTCLVLVGIMLISLVACKKDETVKIGVLVSDSSSGEGVAFHNYYTEYIQEQYPVEFVYSDEVKDADGEKSAIDTLVEKGCKAVISFSSFDHIAQLKECTDKKVYYAIATGTLSQEEYDANRENEYYVGSIGPSLETEYHTGYEMAKYYLKQGKKKFAIFGGAVPYHVALHIYRVAGMISAMCEVGGGDYKGATNMAGILQQISKDGTVETGTIGDIEVMGYVDGFNFDDAWLAKCADMSKIQGLEVILSVANGSDFFGETKGENVKIASVDAFVNAYGNAMQDEKLDYIAGKFSASIGPIFVATLRAVKENPIRNENGYAFRLNQEYWIAKDYDQFNNYFRFTSSKEKPVYTKKMLDPLLEEDYDDFQKFVTASSFEAVQELSE